MSSFVEKLLEFAKRVAVLGALIGFVVFLLKTGALRWQMAVILVLMFMLVGMAIFAVVVPRALMKRQDIGFAGAYFLLGGALSYVFTPIAFYSIHKLSSSLDIRWPLYASVILFVVMVVLVYRGK